jgi:hypothetical protein
MARSWRRLNNEELHNLYTSPNFISVIKPRRIRWAGHVACMEEMHTKILSENLKRPHGRYRHRWEDISMDLWETW